MSSTHKIFSAILLLITALAFSVAVNTFADQAQYFYDELGRLAVVVDADKNVAVYNYDAVGNLLSIDHFAQGSGSIGIYTLSPSSGVVGTQVDIRGFGFSATPSENQVAFNGQAASVLTSTTDTVRAVVPTNATTGSVTVTNTNGTATSPKPFTMLLPPRILGVDPNQVPQGERYPVTIIGDNLATATAVQFAQSGLSAAIVQLEPQGLRIAVTAASTVPLGSYPFSVTTPFGVVNSGAIMITVLLPNPSFDVAGQLSVFMPFPSTDGGAAPSGNTAAVASPTSAFMPLSTDESGSVALSGPSASAAAPTSAFMPLLTEVSGSVAPSGPSATAAAPTSAFMPLSTVTAGTVAPSGPTERVAKATSVFMPLSNLSTGKVAPSGPSETVSKPLSVLMPSATQSAPHGSSESIAPPLSVSMP